MKRAGMIVAVEMAALQRRYGEPRETIQDGVYTVMVYPVGEYELYVLSSGVGEIAAAAGTQYLITKYNVELILNFGVVGALTEEMSEKKICIVKEVCHYPFDLTEIDDVEQGRYTEFPDRYIQTTPELIARAQEVYPDLTAVRCASGDRFVGNEKDKRYLHDEFGADICEMEAAGIILTCVRNHIPVMSIKMVSDSVHGGADEFRETLDEASDACVHVLDQILLNA
ncbi:MAG: 5'-methylthioadenosine/S-adenosylhomocysteine nucleosidase [Solobacterium sp.]|nr:5'-methylthioadenosine/S-adenosylhomocysteine nucleosidase [Solobacterium sp.]